MGQGYGIYGAVGLIYGAGQREVWGGPSGLYCAMMVTLCPAFFSATAACSWVAPRRSTPFTCGNHGVSGGEWG